MALVLTLLLSQLYQEAIVIDEAGLRVAPPRGWTRGVYKSFPELKGVFLSPEGARLAIVAGRKGSVRREKGWLARNRVMFRKKECRHGSFKSTKTGNALVLTCTKRKEVVALALGVVNGVPITAAFRCDEEPGGVICRAPFRQYRTFLISLFGRSLPARMPEFGNHQ